MVKKAVHVVVSLDPKTILTKISYPGTRSKVVRVLKRAGLHSGALIFHEKRYHCAKCDSPIPDYHKECPVCGEKTFVWVSSPHFHAVGFGWIRGTGDIFKKFGWIVVNLKQRRSVYATFQYVLSHATYFVDPSPKGKPVSFHITTWFGRLAYNQMRSIPRLDTIRPVCPYCGMLLMRMEDEELNGFPPPVEFDRYLETFL
jgi:DNA-directed RNA polymerase subunit RPC12/RpoP